MAQTHRILLTGANGYIASHILAQLLSKQTYSVRAVVRSQSKVEAIKSLFPTTPSSRLDFAIVPDMTKPGAFDEALTSSPAFDTVMHTASPFLYSVASSAQDFLEPAVKGTTEILTGVQRVAKDSVKRVIVTSSFAAVGFDPKEVPGRIYTEADWNPVTLDRVEKTWAKGIKGPAYAASKTFAERAAWDFVQKNKNEVKWDLVTINPPMVYGPIAHSIKSMKDLSESSGQIYNGFFADKTPSSKLPRDGLTLYADVRDVATAHIRAMEVSEARNQRFGICGGDIRFQELADLFRKEIPGAQDRVPVGTPGNVNKEGAIRQDVSRAEKVLGMKWRSKEETFLDMAKQFVELEKETARASRI
ncbi:hypothetical protein BKA63DRAFT_83502 [Paraphoma chrysanthemicola]|nr:hypothetical protein BKA63DRAFT_83502 [Paraphoma chrysanthemicola]